MKTEQILAIAQRYYEDNMPQEDIARSLSVSRSTVSRAIKLARERGWVHTVVVAPSGNAGTLEAWFRKRFDLKHVAVVPTSGTQYTNALDAVARVAAGYVDGMAPEEGVVTVGSGRTLLAMARQARPAYHPAVTVLPAMGGWLGQSAISANEVARELAIRWQALAGALFAPAFVSDSRVREALLADAGTRSTLEKARGAVMACIGIAAVTTEPTNVQARYANSSGLVSEEETSRLLSLGAVGETCAQFYDIHGNSIDSWNRERTVTLPLHDIREIPTVLAVGAGVEKALAFLGACRGRLMRALIISEDLAAEVERLDKIAR